MASIVKAVLTNKHKAVLDDRLKRLRLEEFAIYYNVKDRRWHVASGPRGCNMRNQFHTTFATGSAAAYWIAAHLEEVEGGNL